MKRAAGKTTNIERCSDLLVLCAYELDDEAHHHRSNEMIIEMEYSKGI